jgi:hypothetical protein
MISSQLILLHPADNVLICRQPLCVGDQLLIDGASVSAVDPVEVGHKIARHALGPGEKVIKYGAPIGSITAQVDAARHVHMHNMKSDYIAGHTRQAILRETA